MQACLGKVRSVHLTYNLSKDVGLFEGVHLFIIVTIFELDNQISAFLKKYKKLFCILFSLMYALITLGMEAKPMAR